MNAIDILRTNNIIKEGYVKYQGKYLKYIQKIKHQITYNNKTIGYEYDLSDPLKDNEIIFTIDNINKKDEIHPGELQKFTGILDLCIRHKSNPEYLYDVLNRKYKITLSALKRIVNQFRVSNYEEQFNLNNIIKNPFDFITENSSFISFEKAENISIGEGLNIPFETLCIKWSFDSIRSSHLGYVKKNVFMKEFYKFCHKKKRDIHKYKSIIENECKTIGEYITTYYYYNLEKKMGDTVVDLVDSNCENFDISHIHGKIELYEDAFNLQLTEKQKEAVIHGINENFSIITGYPGTGKTMIAHCIIWIYQELNLDKKYNTEFDQISYNPRNENYSHNKSSFSSISVLAPTGKAFLNIFNKLKSLGLDRNISGTIHKCIYSSFPFILNTKNDFDDLIETAVSYGIEEEFAEKYLSSALFNKERTFGNYNDEKNYKKLKTILNNERIKTKKERIIKKEDCLIKEITFMIIDEMSMVDNYLFSELLKWVESFSCKVLILGDKNQLPSVEAGCVLENLINSNAVCVTNFTEIKRQDDSNGKLVDVIKTMGINKKIYIKDFDNITIIYEDINKYINSDKTYNTSRFNLDIIERYGINHSNSKILSYFKKNKFKLNKILQKKFTEIETKRIPKTLYFQYDTELIEFNVGDKIIRMKNDYTEDRMNANGEEAIIVDFDEKTFLVTIKYESMEKNSSISIEELYEEFELAYSLTIHKSQGSQYDIVVLFLECPSEYIDTKIIYTGISRAIKKCIVVTTPRVLTQIQDNKTEKPMSVFMKEFDEWKY
jgi:hypothetical protein